MPRIRVAPAKAEEAAANTREFALLHQWQDTPTTELLAPYAPADALSAIAEQGDLSFDEFAQAMKQPSQFEAAAGQGNFLGWAAHDVTGKLTPIRFTRRALGPKDVHIKITHAGMCHSDLHTIRGEWGPASYPVVPGHEIVGIVSEVGSEVTRFKLGDRAGVGVFVDSCKDCKWCNIKDETYCSKIVLTYNSKHYDGLPTYGGYSTGIVMSEDYTLRIPDNLPLERTAPLLCAGITCWSPLKDYELDKPGTKVGVVGLGGLGHMAVKLAKAHGCEVTVLSRSEAKKEQALAMGADHYLVSSDAAAMAAAEGSLQGIIDTVSAVHDIGSLLNLLEPRGKLVMVGLPAEKMDIPHFPIIFKHLTFGGSLIGNLKDTQSMLDFCGEHNITSDVELIDMQNVNEAMDRLERGDVKFRFVIDINKSLIQ